LENFENVIKRAYELLPIEKKKKPWTFVNHGIGLLQTEDELNCYLAAYGKMHQEKIRTALSALKNPSETLNKNYQIIDWGSGQGLATLCFFDFLEENNILYKPKKVVLIEPSNQALKRAREYIDLKGYKDVEVHTINKFLNDVELSDISSSNSKTLNFFSNILDIETINLEKIARLLKNNLIGEQFFFCVGPLNTNSTRIDKFAKLLDFTDEQIIGSNQGRLKTTRGTIKLLVCKIKGIELEIIKSIYYPAMPRNNNYTHILQKKLNDVNTNNLSEVDKIIEYYKLIVELEQLKQPKVSSYFLYNYEINTDNEFILDLESNNDFLNVFNTNRDRNQTTFPKDLIIAIQYSNPNGTGLNAVLSYTYLFDDVKNIDTANENIRLRLSDFEISYPVLSKLEKTEQEIDEIEELVKQQNSLEDVKNILIENIDNDIIFNTQFSLALSSKNPAQSQIYSELRRVNDNNADENSLLHKFLFNNGFTNRIANLSDSDLIQITKLDESQKNAVLAAFNNKFSVITGPPGSGKTQVISNIIANAVLQDKKVLVASKNNQAVDNVKARFNSIDEVGYFLRFGSKTNLENITIPEINRIINIRNELVDNFGELQNATQALNEQKNIKQECLSTLNKRDELVLQLPTLQQNVRYAENDLLQLQNNNNLIDGFRAKFNIQIIDQYNSQLKSKKNIVDLKYSGLWKFWFDWFSKKKYAIEFISTIDRYPLEIRNYLNHLNISNQSPFFKNGNDILDAYNRVIRAFDSILEYINNYTKKSNHLNNLRKALTNCNDDINTINDKETELKNTIENCNKQILNLSKNVLNEKIKNKLFNSTTAYINNYRDYLPNNIPYHFREVQEFIQNTINFLSLFNINCVTSLSAKAAFPLVNDLFDILVIDEASQCDIASAIPLILRAKQVVIIGDPLQLKHITSLEQYEEEKIKEHLHLSGTNYLQYKTKSLWDYSKDFLANANINNKPINMVGHYRCHPDIIEYSNQAFYIPKLGTNLEIHTKQEDFTFEPKGIIWKNVVGEQRENKNINDAEVRRSIELAIQLAEENEDISIGIVTPFRHQADELNINIPNNLNNRITAATVYIFQGDEKDIMIYSLMVTNNSPASKLNWIDHYAPELVNVAVTRARNTLYIVGNKEYIRANSEHPRPLGRLLRYEEDLNGSK